MPIRVLPPEVTAKIAAGEVIERPASVVKELIENSIDAGAREIKIEVRQGGRRLIRVIDDGVGIPAHEVELAFERHSTSKLETVEDLARIATLGFRGEALPSIAAVAQVTVVTRAQGEEIGTRLRLEGGKAVQREKRGGAQGTVVSVENLFYNTPARLKFLRTEATEAGHISELVSRYAMAFPELRFSLLSEGRMTFQSTGSGKLYDALIQVYGLEVAQQMLRLEAGNWKPEAGADEPSIQLPAFNFQHPTSSIQVYGYISPPSLNRSNRKHLTFFVNRRWVQDRMLSYAVEEAYHTLLPKGRHPLIVLNLRLDPNDVDVNVHPTKREVRFRNSHDVFTAVQRGVRRTLTEQTPIPTVIPHPHLVPGWERQQKLMGIGRGRKRRGEMALEVQRTADVEVPPAFEAPRPVKLPPLRVLGQMAQTYIITEGPEGMYLVDQHSAHERVLYERFRAERAKMAVASQALLEPLTIELTSPQGAAVAENLEALAKLGFDIEPFGSQTWLVRAVPGVLKDGNVQEALDEMLDNLTDGGPGRDWEEAAMVSIICHSAVRAGQTLSQQEMQELIRQLEKTAMPHTCPHGRPTMIHLSQAQLEKEFGRKK